MNYYSVPAGACHFENQAFPLRLPYRRNEQWLLNS